MPHDGRYALVARAGVGVAWRAVFGNVCERPGHWSAGFVPETPPCRLANVIDLRPVVRDPDPPGALTAGRPCWRADVLSGRLGHASVTSTALAAWPPFPSRAMVGVV